MNLPSLPTALPSPPTRPPPEGRGPRNTHPIQGCHSHKGNPMNRTKIKPADPHVRKQDRDDLSRQAREVLNRLEDGPATATELTYAGGGARIAARVFGLNEHFRRNKEKRRIKGGFPTGMGRVYVYRIERAKR